MKNKGKLILIESLLALSLCFTGCSNMPQPVKDKSIDMPLTEKLQMEEQQGSTMIEMTLDDVVEQAEKEALQQSEQINSEAGGDQDGE